MQVISVYTLELLVIQQIDKLDHKTWKYSIVRARMDITECANVAYPTRKQNRANYKGPCYQSGFLARVLVHTCQNICT